MRRGVTFALTVMLACGRVSGAVAQAPDASSAILRSQGLPDATAWWSDDGRAGWAPDTQWLGVAYPWTIAGLVRGGWSLDDASRLGGVRQGPGVARAHAPLTWFDSLAVAGIGGDAAWRGFEAGMVPVRGIVPSNEWSSGSAPHTVSMFSFQRGSSAMEENALALERTDSLSSLRFEVLSGERGAVGAYEDAGDHRYGLEWSLERGAHHFDASFAHRGSAMAITGGAAGEMVNGAGGTLGWEWADTRDRVRLELRRATDWHESYGWLIDPSRRDQSEDGAEATWTREQGDDRLALRAAWWKGQVRRVTAGVPVFDDQMNGWWLATRDTRDLGPIAVDAGLGFGAQDGTGGGVVAPSFGATLHRRSFRTALRFERIVTPIWSDLAPSVTAFLQDTWSGALTLGFGDAERHAWLTGRVGRALHRAIADRLPLEDLWLRDGYDVDPDPYRFALVSADGAWGGRDWRATLEGYAFVHSASVIQSAVDPVNGLHASLEGGAHVFNKELGARLRLEAGVVGARQSQATDDWLPAYVTFGAGGVFSLSDVIVVVEALGLENRPRPLTWIDPRTGQDALGPGLESRITFSWRLFN